MNTAEGLKIVRNFQATYLSSVICGSVGLLLHGVYLGRSVTFSDVDVMMSFVPTGYDKGRSHSMTDFDDCIIYRETKFDIKKQYNIPYVSIFYGGHIYRVSPLRLIVDEKLKYALAGSQKHIKDIRNMRPCETHTLAVSRFFYGCSTTTGSDTQHLCSHAQRVSGGNKFDNYPQYQNVLKKLNGSTDNSSTLCAPISNNTDYSQPKSINYVTTNSSGVSLQKATLRIATAEGVFGHPISGRASTPAITGGQVGYQPVYYQSEARARAEERKFSF